MFKPKIILNFLKRQRLNLFFLAVGVFCLFNVFTNLNKSFTLVADSLSLALIIYYFSRFEKENIKKIKESILNIKWPFSSKTKKVLTNALNYIYEKKWEIIFYLFLLLLSVTALENFTYLKNFINLSWIKEYQPLLIILTIACGGLTFWHNWERIKKKIEEEQSKEKLLTKNKKFLIFLFNNLFLFSILLIIIINLESLFFNNFFNLQILLFNIIFSGFIIFFIYFIKKGKEHRTMLKNISGFFSFLLLITSLILEHKELNFPMSNWILFLITTFSCFLFFYFNDTQIFRPRKIIKETKLKKWDLIIISTLLLIGSFLLLFNIDKNNFANDEFPTINSAYNFNQTGNFYKWDWLENKSSADTIMSEQDQWANYTRAEVYTILLSSTYKIFGISEASSRMVSAILIFLFFIIAYYLSKKKFFNKNISKIFLFLCIFSPLIIQYGRYTRLYSMLILVYFIFIVLIFNLIYCEKLKKTQKIILLLITSILFAISLNLHPLSLICIPIILILLLLRLRLLIKNKKLFFNIFLLFLIITTITILYFYFLKKIPDIFDFVVIGKNKIYPNNYIYFRYLTSYPVGIFGPSVVSSYFLYLLLFVKNKKYYYTNFYIYLYSLVLFTLIVFVFFIDRFSNPIYIVSTISFFLLLLSVSLHAFVISFNISLKKILTTIFIIIVILNFLNNTGVIYGEEGRYFVDYQTSFSILKKNIKPNDQIIIQYERFYYLRNLPTTPKIVRFGGKDYTEKGEKKFIKNLLDSNSGWITWEESTKGDIKKSTRQFITDNFQNFSVPGTNVYLFYYNTNDLISRGAIKLTQTQ